MLHTARGLIVAAGLCTGLLGACASHSMQEIADHWIGADREEVVATLGEPVQVIEPFAEGGPTVYRYTQSGTVTHAPTASVSPFMGTGRVISGSGQTYDYRAAGSQMTTTPAWEEGFTCVLDLTFDAQWKVSKAKGYGC